MPKASFTGRKPAALVETKPHPNLARQSRVARRHPGVRHVAGCMTGTSLDGIDLVLLGIDGHGTDMRVQLVAQANLPLGEVGTRLRRLAEQQPMTAGEIVKLANDFSALHIEALQELTNRQELDLVAVHGQTVFHAPPLSWQLINPVIIAHTLSVPVVYDLRAADLAVGGQGAPITPLADYILFRHSSERRVIVNLGGFCNITRLPAHDLIKQIDGGDVCACNQVLDALARKLLGMSYDRDGQRALAGEVKARPMAALVERLKAQAEGERSLGTGDELASWADQFQVVAPDDLMRSACAAIAEVIVKAAGDTDRIALSGGGVRNRALVYELRERSTALVSTTDDLGIPATLREATAMAILGALCEDRVPITVKRITGVTQAPVAGCWVRP